MPFRRASASATPNSQSNSNPNSPASFAAALASASSPSTSQPSTSLEREQLQFQRLISFDQARRSFIQDQNNNQDSNRSNLKPTGSTSTQRRHSTPANQSHPDGFGGFSSSSVPQVASPSPMSPASDSQVSVMAKIGKKDKDRRKPSMSIGDDLPHFPTSQPSTGIQSTPHLPMAARALESNNQSRSSFRISPGAAPITTTTTTASDNYTALPAKYNTSTARRPSYKREDTPSLLHGDNAMLIDREISRLREKDGQKRKMSARVRAGVASLVVLGLSTYILAQYIISWLALSPGTYVGSDAASGTPVSPDPQLRTISLIAFAAAAASVAGCLGTIEYLRSSRRPSCGTYFTWFVAILSTTVQLGLACANLALIVIWHKLYTKPENSSNPLALTRDVGQRCQGNWDLDLLWSAAKYSSQSDDAQAHSCDKDPTKTTEMFLVVGGIRLGLFVVFCSIWLVLLGKYNKVLKEEAKLLREGGVTIEESAEMHKLLEDEEKLLDEKVTRDTPGGWNDSPQIKYVDEDDDRTLTHKAGRDYAEFVYEREIPGEEDEDEIDHLKEGNGSQIIVPPRLNRFDWQRGEPSTAGGVPMQSYQSVPHGDHENDLDHGRSYGHEAQRSEGWSAGIFSRVAEAVGWYSAVPTHEAEERAPRERMASQQEWEKEFYDRRPSNVNVHNPRSMPTPKHSGDSTSSLPQYSMSNVAPASSSSHQQQQQQHQQLSPPPAPSSGAAHHQDSAHTRQGSKLGISAWFRRDASDSVDERDGSFAEPPPPAAPQTQAASQSRIAPPLAPSSSTSSHRRSASQERRASESRHAASRQLNSQHNGARDRSESRERERQTQQQDRISFLAKSGGNDSTSNVQSPTSPSVSVGNDLPHMPALGSTSSSSSKPQPSSKKSTYSSHGAHPEDEDEDGTDFWLQEGDVITRDSLSALPRDHPQREPTYVRTLGKLVRKLSAIESVGSGERASRRGLSDESSPISPHENQLNVPNERRYNARSASSIGESFPGAWTKKF